MKLIGAVSSEGGPLIFLNSSEASDWRGIEDGGDDYRRACALFEANPAPEGGLLGLRGGGQALLWEMGGGGSAEIYPAQAPAWHRQSESAPGVAPPSRSAFR